MSERNNLSRKYVERHLAALTDVLSRATVGDFSKDLTLPKQPNEFSELYAGLQLMLEVVREQTADLKRLNRRLAQQVMETESDLAAAQKIAKLGSFSFDLASNQLVWSEEMYELFGIPTGQPVTMDDVMQLVHPDDVNEVTALRDAALLTGGGYRQQFRAIRPDGTERVMYTRAEVLHRRGKPLRIFGTVQDVTERKQDEDRLHQSQQRFQQLVESLGDYAITILDPDGVVLTWNQGAERIKGYAAEEVIGQPFAIFYPEEERAAAKPVEDLRQAMEHGSYHEEAVRIRKDGSSFWASVVITPLYDRSGTLQGFSKITRDITDQHELLRRQREFISIASHELRTPITALTGYLSLLQNELSKAEVPTRSLVPHFASRSFEAATRISRLVEDLLNVARIEENRVQVKLRPVKAATALQEVIDALRPNALAKQIKVTTQNRLPADCQIMVDRNHFGRVLFNLIDNAIKYTPPEGRIRITATASASRVMITVTDNGIGIQPDNLQRIYDKFFREYTDLSVHAGGTGLGLFITQELVQRQSGTLEITSKPNKGTTARVTFPCHQGKQPNKSKRASR